MPVPDQRDPGLTCSLLQGWLRDQLPLAGNLIVSGLRMPSAATGFSNETLLFDAEWEEEGGRRRLPLVARVAPTSYRLFPDTRFEAESRIMRILDAETGVPLPAVRWVEAGADPLGAPFVVMDRVSGLVPGDSPTYHQDGWLVEASPEDRARLWWGALEVLAGIHRLDVDALGLGFLDRPEYGRSGLDQQLGYYERFVEWAGAGDLPDARRALAWLRANQPVETGPPGLLWGDARIGNVVFDDFEPRAVLDWEMVALGQPEVDLAWFLYFDRHHSEGCETPRLAGFPGPEETIARYERLLGRPMRDLAYYEVFAALRFAVIMARLGVLFIQVGWMPPDSDFSTTNTAAKLLRVILEQRC
jgi:aminoglycoside phosphotransferase (APT) family kinase protein